MAADAPDFARWLDEAAVPEATLSAGQRAVLHAAFCFLQRCGRDYFSVRLLSHFLLHCQAGLPVAQVARLLGLSRSAASAQQGLSSKEVVQAAHHRLRGRSHGKLLPRFAGPIAQFLHQHQGATRWDLLDFIQRTWGVSVSRVALHRFLKKYGLDKADPVVTLPKPGPASAAEPAASPPLPTPATGRGADAVGAAPVLAQAAAPPPADEPLPLPRSDFFLPRPGTPAPSCCCPPPWTGSAAPRTASRTVMGPCVVDC
jgi:transposase